MLITLDNYAGMATNFENETIQYVILFREHENQEKIFGVVKWTGEEWAVTIQTNIQLSKDVLYVLANDVDVLTKRTCN